MDIPKTSRAAVITRYLAPIEIRDIPIPEKLEHGAILVKTAAASMCASDVHAWEGILAQMVPVELPIIPGHEMVGTIVKLGEGATHDAVGQPLRLGDNIVFEPGACGSCYACTVLNSPNICPNRRLYMVPCCEKFPYLVGAFSEYIYVYPESRRLRVPGDLPVTWVAATSCALRTVMHGFDRLGHVGAHESVVIQGAGPLGLYMTAIMDNAGASNIIVLGAPKRRLQLAQKWGARHVISIEEFPDHKDRLAIVRDLTGGRGGDIVVEVSGGDGAFAEGIDLAAPGARYVVIGQVGGPLTTFSATHLVAKNLTVHGIMSAEIRHFYKSLQFVSNTRHKYNFGEMLSGEYRLDQINEAVASYRAGNEIKPLIVP